MVRILGSTGTRRRRTWLALGTAAALTLLAIPATSFADDPSGCDFSPTTKPLALSCVGPLSGSNFEGGDGNLLVSTGQITDWANVAGLNAGIDQASGTGDNSFGQGTKEDDPAVTVVTGSIPPNKSDLTRFYQASETVSGQTFLYLAWERTNVLGSANMDFEINQQATTGFSGTTTGPITLNRQPGDMLITFDFVNGGGRPVLGLNRWLVSATNPVVSYFSGPNTCLSANNFPCWGDHVTLNQAISEGAVNNFDSVTDPINPGAPRTLAASTFGEAAINLTGAGVFGTSGCVTFASTFLKSRASASFPAEVKDFVAPVPTTISNCGRVTIIKNTDPRGLDQNFSYASNVTGTTLADPTSSACATGSYTLNDAGTNTNDCFNVPAGSNYAVTEGADPIGFAFESLTCIADGAGASGTPNGRTANIVVTPDSHVTCTFVNQRQLGAILITKTSSKGTHPGLAGAVFHITGPNGYSSDATTLAGGTICVGSLGFGTYSVQETAAPTGYVIDDSAAHDVVVNANSTCGDGHEATFSATDTPVSDIQVRFRDGGSGATTGTISCDNTTGTTSTANTTGWDNTTTVTGVHAPTTIHCTITIDP
jgi:hypothetical protein